MTAPHSPILSPAGVHTNMTVGLACTNGTTHVMSAPLTTCASVALLFNQWCDPVLLNWGTEGYWHTGNTIEAVANFLQYAKESTGAKWPMTTHVCRDHVCESCAGLW